MAGTSPDFDRDGFIEGIHSAMEMAAPPDVAERATFFLPAVLTYVGPVDESGVPFDPDVTVTSVRPAGIQVPCAIEYYDDQGQLLPGFGVIAATRIKITLLGDDWEKVSTFEYVVAGGDKYVRRRLQPPSGLFDVGLYEVWCHAEQET